MLKTTLLMLIILMPLSAFSSEKNTTDIERIAKQYGFSKTAALDNIEKSYKEGGLSNLQSTLFYTGEFSKNYKVNQKVENNLIYLIPNKYRQYVSLPSIAVKPLEGEFSQKGTFIPGKYYKVLDLMTFTKLDGFPITLPLLERVMDKKKMHGYGVPLNDKSTRKNIIGTWSDGWDKNSSKNNEIINIDIYKPNGVYESIELSHNLTDSTWEKQLFKGTWDINNLVLNKKYEGLSVWKKNSSSSKWVVRKYAMLGSGSNSEKIIKLSSDNLITARRTEKDFSRLTTTQLNELLK